MKIAIMQPYFFPYIGYWQLIHAVDTFVIYDDVNYIKKGWINRNRILVRNEPHLFTLPVKKASQNRMICDTELSVDYPKWRQKFLKQVQQSYSQAPFFESCIDTIKRLLQTDELQLSQYLGAVIIELAKELSLETHFVYSSDLVKKIGLRAHDRIINICKVLGAQTYVNAPGGRGLYRHEDFAEQGLELRFLECDPISYAQFGREFVPNLSIIDVMMFNGRDIITAFLERYRLDREDA